MGDNEPTPGRKRFAPVLWLLPAILVALIGAGIRNQQDAYLVSQGVMDPHTWTDNQRLGAIALGVGVLLIIIFIFRRLRG